MRAWMTTLLSVAAGLGLVATVEGGLTQRFGVEVAVSEHLGPGEIGRLTLGEILDHGRTLFTAMWTLQEGGGRPATRGNGEPLVNPVRPLVFPRNFNRLSAPDSNACSGCHNLPFLGGAGEAVANVFVLGERFDFVTFDPVDAFPTEGAFDEQGRAIHMETFANRRNPPSLFGAGFIELLARQITVDLRSIRDRIAPGGSAMLESQRILFGTLSRDAAGRWVTSDVRGLSPASLASGGPNDPPGLEVRPFHQAGVAVSLGQFSLGAFNQHHGIQAVERFGDNTDPDQDGFRNELTRDDVTAAVLWQAALPVPGRVIPRDPAIEQAVRRGEEDFAGIGCAVCHRPELALGEGAWVFSEPGPFNPPEVGRAPTRIEVDLTDARLAGPRPSADNGVVRVPAYTDLRLHDITSGPGDPNRDPLDMNSQPGSPEFFKGNARFMTRPLWGVATTPPYFHHGQFSTMREAILAHEGEAAASRNAFLALGSGRQDFLIEFLKTLRLLPPGTPSIVVDEEGNPREWP